MLAITGEEFSGSCLFCDFTLDIDTTVTSEKGSDCDYDAYPFAHLMEGSVVSDVFLGWADSYVGYYQTYEDLLWFGFGTFVMLNTGGEVAPAD